MTIAVMPLLGGIMSRDGSIQVDLRALIEDLGGLLCEKSLMLHDVVRIKSFERVGAIGF